MKFELRKFDFELALDEIRVNQKALTLAHIQAAHLLTNGSGFSATQEPILDTQLGPTQQSSTRRAAGYSELDQLNDEMDLLEHLNIDQHGNNHGDVPDHLQPPVSEHEEVANAVKFLGERFTRVLRWFDSKDPRENYIFTPRELIEQFHQAKFIDRSIITIHKPAT